MPKAVITKIIMQKAVMQKVVMTKAVMMNDHKHALVNVQKLVNAQKIALMNVMTKRVYL